MSGGGSGDVAMERLSGFKICFEGRLGQGEGEEVFINKNLEVSGLST